MMRANRLQEVNNTWS